MCEPSPVWCLPETLKLYVTQVVVEPAVGDRKPEASLNRQVFVLFFLSFQIHTRDCRCQRFCSHAHVD